MIAPKSKSPITIANRNIVKLVGSANRRLLGQVHDRFAGSFGGISSEPEGRRDYRRKRSRQMARRSKGAWDDEFGFCRKDR